MKVGCICNINNNLFALVRHLRSAGVDAELLIFDNENLHFHPSCDTFDEEYRSFTRTVSWGSLFSFSSVPRATIERDVAPYDFLIGSGMAPAFMATIDRHLDVFISSGGDIFEDTQIRYVDLGEKPFSISNIRWQIRRTKFALAQRKGLKNARYIETQNPTSRRLLTKFGFEGEILKSPIPMVYSPLFNPANAEQLRANFSRYPVLRSWVDVLTEHRDGHFPIVFHHARHIWKSRPHAYSNKGNDVLIRGFAKFVKERPDLSPLLVTTEYGVDVSDSKRLIRDLRIEKNVLWLPLMHRKEILACLSMVDIAASTFSDTWLISGVIFEALSMARPLMCTRNDAEIDPDYPEPYTVMNAHNDDDVSAQLQAFAENPEPFREMGRAGLSWYERNVVERTISRMRSLIEASG